MFSASTGFAALSFCFDSASVVDDARTGRDDGLALSGDESRAARKGDVGPEPLPENLDATAEADEKKYMDKEPGEPCNKA